MCDSENLSQKIVEVNKINGTSKIIKPLINFAAGSIISSKSFRHNQTYISYIKHKEICHQEDINALVPSVSQLTKGNTLLQMATHKYQSTNISLQTIMIVATAVDAHPRLV